MKSMSWLVLPLILFAGLAQAYDRGDRIEHRWDARGDRIDARFDRRAEYQEALGHEQRAEYLDREGDRIDARFDRIGARREARFDRRH
jgi:hypothetical protein